MARCAGRNRPPQGRARARDRRRGGRGRPGDAHPRDAWWTAEFQAAPAHLDAYCDVATPSTESGSSEVTMVDLDLDVCRVREDMSVFVDDEDELAVHQVRYCYPADVVEWAEAAGAWLTVALRDGVEPFGDHYRTWIDQLPATRQRSCSSSAL
ncbi:MULTISPECIES: DUF402 domain-containing protein [unclassified Isoptericola]|uniref:DUF402 domain-containing protein n=1 Tax=unclassified Isoptericola TaxID=2623355 RepID=UPI00378AC0EA